MLNTLKHAQKRPGLLPKIAGCPATWRSYTPHRVTKSHLETTTPVAEELLKTGSWQATSIPRKRKNAETKLSAENLKKKAACDPTRINVVGDKLCDDVVSYIGPTLERHVGCDLIDINPGAGVWSRKLRDVLQPRSHIMLEPEAQYYRPFLEPILAQPNTKLLPSSAFFWHELTQAMGHIDNQKPVPPDERKKPKRNDTLLVTANISFYPPKRSRYVESLAPLLLFQLLSSIRAGQLFQQYGLVRMLIWARPDDVKSFIPKMVQKRRKPAIDAEVSCDWMAEVAVPTTEEEKGKRVFRRESTLSADSMRGTLERMREAGIKMPAGREGPEFKEARLRFEQGQPHEGETAKESRAWDAEREDLEARLEAGEFTKTNSSKEWKRLWTMRRHAKAEVEEAEQSRKLLARMRELCEMRPKGRKPTRRHIEQWKEKWLEELNSLSNHHVVDFRLWRDDRHLFDQNPPGMLWDRRPYEPMTADATEFFPNIGCTLVDIQPKAVHPLLHETGRDSSHAADIFEMMQRTMMSAGSDPVRKAVERLSPGAADGILPFCPSLEDPDRGGIPIKDELSPRALNETQWLELLEAFMDWPFRPTYEEMIGHTMDDGFQLMAGDEDGGGGGGSGPMEA